MSLTFITLIYLPLICLSNPEQIHLAGTTDVNTYTITWASPESCQSGSFVMISNAQSTTPTIRINGTCSIFNESNPNGLHYYHRVIVTELDQLTKYYYYVSSGNIKSSTFAFKTLSSSNNEWIPKLLIYGDLGHRGGEIEHELFTVLPSVTKQVDNASVDLIFHAGDFAYDLLSTFAYPFFILLCMKHIHSNYYHIHDQEK